MVQVDANGISKYFRQRVMSRCIPAPAPAPGAPLKRDGSRGTSAVPRHTGQPLKQHQHPGLLPLVAALARKPAPPAPPQRPLPPPPRAPRIPRPIASTPAATHLDSRCQSLRALRSSPSVQRCTPPSPSPAELPSPSPAELGSAQPKFSSPPALPQQRTYYTWTSRRGACGMAGAYGHAL